MKNTEASAGWATRELRDVIPESARPAVVAFIRDLLAERTRGSDNVARRATAALEPYREDFSARGMDLGWFSYRLEYARDRGELPAWLKALGQSLPWQAGPTGLPAAVVAAVEEFVAAFRGGQLIVEPGKSVQVMLRERVLEPHRDQLRGCRDFGQLAWDICVQCGVVSR